MKIMINMENSQNVEMPLFVVLVRLSAFESFQSAGPRRVCLVSHREVSLEFYTFDLQATQMLGY